MKRLRTQLSYANVIATIALFVALGGGAYAAVKLPKNSVGSAQIRKSAVTSPKVKDHSLLAKDFKTGQLPKGAKGDTGATGPQGPKGDKGDPGPATGAAGGALSGNYPNPSIATGAVGGEQIADGAVSFSKLGRPPFGYTVTPNTQSIPSGSFTRVDFPATHGEQDVTFTTTPGASNITVAKSGWYFVSGSGTWDANTTGAFRLLNVQVQRPGHTDSILLDQRSTLTPGLTQTFAGTVHLDPGEAIIATAAQDSGTSRVLTFTINVVGLSGAGA